MGNAHPQLSLSPGWSHLRFCLSLFSAKISRQQRPPQVTGESQGPEKVSSGGRAVGVEAPGGEGPGWDEIPDKGLGREGKRREDM